MATEQILKKKLRGVRSIQKVSKALRTASTVKFSAISAACKDYSLYADRCRKLYTENRALFENEFAPKDPYAPPCVIVMAGNKGMCGSFNFDLLSFAEKQLQKCKNARIILCGKQSQIWFKDNSLSYDHAFDIDDIPVYGDAEKIFKVLDPMLRKGEISGIEIIYPEYRNMLSQIPTQCTLVGEKAETKKGSLPLFFPDRESVVRGMRDKVLTAFLYEKILECAMGAQAATLMTMRSSYDTASEYSEQLDSEINRIRQKRVTADVIETSSEFSREEE